MYAIIKTGGKQYRVAVGDIINVELLAADHGSQVEFGEVLFAFDGAKVQVGKPNIENFLVYGKVVGTTRGPKIKSTKYKPSHNQRRTWGHRQDLLCVEITGIGKAGKEGRHGT